MPSPKSSGAPVVEWTVSGAWWIEHDRKGETQLAALQASKPGHRFQDRYRRRQESEHGWTDPRRPFYVLGGLILALGSLAFGVLPGPGMLTFFVGVGMIAGEFRPVARLLDWAEVPARELGRWVGGIWGSSVAGKVLIVFVGAICFAVVLWVAYLLLFAG